MSLLPHGTHTVRVLLASAAQRLTSHVVPAGHSLAFEAGVHCRTQLFPPSSDSSTHVVSGHPGMSGQKRVHDWVQSPGVPPDAPTHTLPVLHSAMVKQ